MTSVNDPVLISELRRDEGVEREVYKDSVGIDTIGVGHNLYAKPLPESWSPPLTDLQIDQLLSEDLVEVFEGLDKHMPDWKELSEPRQRVLVNMAFNMGIEGLMTFKNTLKAIEESNYSYASALMMQSKWARQVGARASRLSSMMSVG